MCVCTPKYIKLCMILVHETDYIRPRFKELGCKFPCKKVIKFEELVDHDNI